MPSRFLLLAVLSAALAEPAVAHAEGYVGPGIGIAFGNPSAQGLADFVFDVGWLPAEPVGLELDTTYAPSFFGRQGSYGSNSVTTLMGNVIVAAPDPRRSGPYRGPIRRAIGPSTGPSVRPYISGGFGMIRENTSVPSFSRTDLGANLGAGIMAAASGQVGVRGDLRYFRDLVGTADGNNSSIDFGSFHFWRVSVSLLFRF